MSGQPVIVGVDGSPESAAAASAGWMVAEAAGVDCRLVHATRDGRTALEMSGTGVALETLQLAMLARARNDILPALDGRVPPLVAHDLLVRPGGAAAVLDGVIAETDAQMLVLGGKHHSTLGRWFGGSTVQHVVRRVDIPLLVTAGDLRPRPRVMVAVDTSYAARPTIEQATAFARLLGGPLHALHVIEPAATVPEVLLRPDPLDHEGWSRERIERDVWSLLPIPDHHKVIRRGTAVETIAQEATAWRADVIVVGSHGKSWVNRLLIGSTTEALLNDLPGAVLVIPVPAPVSRVTVPAWHAMAVAPA
jgi:nucleotide-binding universal stress UspA family protein